jgi:uncharacterized protein YndB with AHSA1/START domain
MRFEATIDVAAPAQLVFEVYADVERWPEWTARDHVLGLNSHAFRRPCGR